MRIGSVVFVSSETLLKIITKLIDLLVLLCTCGLLCFVWYCHSFESWGFKVTLRLVGELFFSCSHKS